MGPAVFALRRGPFEGRTVLALHNLTAAAQSVEAPDAGPGWVDLVGGREFSEGEPLELGPYGVAWLSRD